MAAIFENVFRSGYSVFFRYPGVENFDEIALSPPQGSKILMKSLYLAPLRRYEQLCVFGENSKWPPFLKIFSELVIVYSLDTQGVENFDEIALFPNG